MGRSERGRGGDREKRETDKCSVELMTPKRSIMLVARISSSTQYCHRLASREINVSSSFNAFHYNWSEPKYSPPPRSLGERERETDERGARVRGAG